MGPHSSAADFDGNGGPLDNPCMTWNLPCRRSARHLAAIALCCVAGCDPPPPPRPTSHTAQPQRIVSIAPNATEIVALLGAGDRLVGVCDFCVWPAEIAAVPRVGGFIDPSLERILHLEPDLLILRGDNPEIERLCRNNGIRLFRDPTESFDDIPATVRLLGDLLGRRDEAERIVADMDQALARVERAVAGRPRPRVFFCIARKPDSLANVTTAGRDTFVDELIRRAGGENIFGASDVPYPQLSLEEILKRQPDVIIEAMESQDVAPATRERIANQWKSLGDLPASRHGRVHVLTENFLLIPSPRIVHSVRLLARLFHPEAQLD